MSSSCWSGCPISPRGGRAVPTCTVLLARRPSGALHALAAPGPAPRPRQDTSVPRGGQALMPCVTHGTSHVPRSSRRPRPFWTAPSTRAGGLAGSRSSRCGERRGHPQGCGVGSTEAWCSLTKLQRPQSRWRKHYARAEILLALASSTRFSYRWTR